MAKKKNRERFVTFLDPSLAEKVRNRADKEKRTEGDLIRFLLWQIFETQIKEKT